jgi:hypothetical protein
MIFQQNPFASLQPGGMPNMAGGGFAGPLSGGLGGGFGGGSPQGGGFHPNWGGAAGAFASSLANNLPGSGSQGGHGGMFGGNPFAAISPLLMLAQHHPNMALGAISPLAGGMRALFK